MTNREILEKAIKKAIDGGWDAEGLGGVEVWQDLSELERQHVVNMLVNYESKTGYMMVIFNHDFAKALWGYGELNFNNKNVAGELVHVIPWQYHLQMMVIDPDPIKYLGENL